MPDNENLDKLEDHPTLTRITQLQGEIAALAPAIVVLTERVEEATREAERTRAVRDVIYEQRQNLRKQMRGYMTELDELMGLNRA